MSKTDEVAKYIRDELKSRINKGETRIDIRAGKIWNFLKDELELTGITQVCSAMRKVVHEYNHQCLLQNVPNGGNSTAVVLSFFKGATENEADTGSIKNAKQSSKIIYNNPVTLQQELVPNVVIKRFTEIELDEAAKCVADDLRYGAEGNIIRDCFIQFLQNIDENIIAMKIALIDTTNSTNLNKHLGKAYLTDLIKRIKECSFDERVANGDTSLVGELANSGKINLFSFFSKYCLYHNYYIYQKDDFVIFDGIMRDHVGEYISEYSYGDKIYKSSQIKGCVNRMRKSYDYEGYKELIDAILETNNIQNSYKHRRFDWFVWYPNRAGKKEDDE